MVRTVRGWVNPILWAILAWAIAVAGNTIAHSLIQTAGHYVHSPSYLHLMIHADEVFVGICVGFMRWLHGEWQLETIHQTRDMEIKMRNALQVLYLGEGEELRRKAFYQILDAFEEDRPIHPEFRLDVERFLLRARKEIVERAIPTQK